MPNLVDCGFGVELALAAGGSELPDSCRAMPREELLPA